MTAAVVAAGTGSSLVGTAEVAEKNLAALLVSMGENAVSRLRSRARCCVGLGNFAHCLCGCSRMRNHLCRRLLRAGRDRR